jgi:F0F1-type ATP synthase membrane subunit b/b'
MSQLLIFSAAAALLATVFLVSLLELIFTIKRRKVHEGLQRQIKDLKASYNESINQLVIQDDATITTAEQQVTTLTSSLTGEKETLEKTYKTQLEEVTASSKKALEAAKKRADKVRQEAEAEANDYLASRKQEVEEELMNLVIEVSKKVLPKGISYEAQKELVMEALRDVQTDTTK